MRCNHAQQLKEYIRPDSKDLAPGNIHKLTISYSSITMTVNDTISISSIIYTNFDFLFFVFGIDKRFIKIIDCRIVIILIHMLAWTDGSFRLLIFIIRAAKSSESSLLKTNVFTMISFRMCRKCLQVSFKFYLQRFLCTAQFKHLANIGLKKAKYGIYFQINFSGNTEFPFSVCCIILCSRANAM